MGLQREVGGGRKIPHLAALVVAASVLFCAGARAGNDRAFFHCDEAAAVGGAAVMATAKDSCAVWYNPAGVSEARTDKIDFSGTAFTLRIRRIPDAISATVAGSERSSDLVGRNFVSAPTALVWLRKPTSRWSVGLGVFVTQLDIADIHDITRQRVSAAGEVFDFSQSLNIAMTRQTYRAGPAFGFRASESFRLGFAMFGVYESIQGYSDFSLSIMRSSSRDAAMTSSLFGFNDRFSMATVGMMMAVGAQWDVSDALHVGIALRSPTFAAFSFGTIHSLDSFAFAGHGEGDLAVATPSEEKVREWSGTMSAPMELSFGLAMERGRFWLGAEGAFTPSLENASLSVARRWSSNFSIGGRARVTDTLSVGCGLFSDRSPAMTPEALGEEQVDYYGAAFGFHVIDPFTVLEKGGRKKLSFATTLGFRYALGLGRAAGLAVAAVSEDSWDISFPVRDVVFHEIGLQLGSGLTF